jgi:hypothetical protein
MNITTHFSNPVFRMGPLLLLFLPLSTLSGCALLVESVQLSIEDMRSVQSGEVIHGKGYSIHVPDSNFYLVRNEPTHGDLSLRWRGDFPANSYNVLTFTATSPGSSLKDAWQADIAKHMREDYIRGYQIISEQTNVWQDSAAWFQTGYLKSDFITANCVVCRGTNYYWIVRSSALLYGSPGAVEISTAENELKAFLAGIRFDQ